jgi:hypothetical protein
MTSFSFLSVLKTWALAWSDYTNSPTYTNSEETDVSSWMLRMA